MSKIDLNAPLAEAALKTTMIYGASGAGKTWIAGTFPRVAWLGSKREGGWRTLKYMRREDFYEASRPPLVYAVSDIPELVAHVREIQQLVQKGDVQTVVIELTFYSDDIVRSAKKRDPQEKNGWAKFQLLEEHITWLDEEMKLRPKLRLHYNAIAATGDVEKSPGGVLLAGKAIAKKIPAMTDLTGYLRAEELNGKVERVLHLSAYGSYSPRHRYGAALPAFVRNPTYRRLEDLLFGRATCDVDGNVIYEGNGAAVVAVKGAALPIGLPPLPLK